LLSYNLLAKADTLPWACALIKQSEVTSNSGSSMSYRQYQNPPIEEAVCEFRFAPSSPWNLTVPGLLYEKIRDGYPGEPKQQNLVPAEFQTGQQQLVTNTAHNLKPFIIKLLFQSHDAKKLVGVGPDLLSIHSLRPYEGWESFERRIDESFHSYIEVSKPAGVTYLAVRYINKIVIPQQNINLGDYFTIYPLVPEGIPNTVSGFTIRTQTTYSDLPIVLTITLSDIPESLDKASFILDLQVFQNWMEKPLDIEKSIDTLHELKQRENAAFESLITDRTRELFDASI